MENALRLTMKAFKELKTTSKHKRETLAYAFEQVKPILRKYMKENHVLALELNLKTKRLLVLESIPNAERTFFVEEWLNGEISTKEFRKKLRKRFQWVQYFNLADFLEGVEVWLYPKCFGLWLDTCYRGYPKCRTCEFLVGCQKEFKRSCEQHG